MAESPHRDSATTGPGRGGASPAWDGIERRRPNVVLVEAERRRYLVTATIATVAIVLLVLTAVLIVSWSWSVGKAIKELSDRPACTFPLPPGGRRNTVPTTPETTQ